MIRWLPWRSIVRRVVRGHGFLDPFVLMARMERFAQPSEVAEPIELLRAGAAMHARGLVNSRVIQNNLDWIWPYWVCRQVDPEDPAFLPRAFSITQINLTHRNWTAVGLPGCEEMPIVDPRGLVTPFLDGWSLDAWMLTVDGRRHFPSLAAEARQQLQLDPLSVHTRSATKNLALETRAEVVRRNGQTVCAIDYKAEADLPGWLVISLRPFNTEGISFIDRIALSDDHRSWNVDDESDVIRLAEAPDRHHVSQYRQGDVTIRLPQAEAADETEVECESGMATAAAAYRIDGNRPLEIGVEVPLEEPDTTADNRGWTEALDSRMKLEIPDDRLQFLFDAALRTMVVLSPHDVYPGPSTYRRFWFRDAAFMINALLCSGLESRARRALDSFAGRQTVMGYFQSQNGEWDSNGEALWALQRYCTLTGEDPDPEWLKPVLSGARWITRKRVDHDSKLPHAGLLPAGFSAEHLGPNDYYYWDDFWSFSGLRSAADLASALDEEAASEEFRDEADDLLDAVSHSLERTHKRTGSRAMPASPYRRLDAGVIGSIVAGYPLQILPADDPRLLESVEFLLSECLVKGGFFHNIIHSGINAYLTLHIAQVLLRAGDPRARELMQRVADLASPTGQWPEAIHPRTTGGCMGDGQHGWAAAEWIMMLRNSFVREEGDRLVVGAGIEPEWLNGEERLFIGPAPTAFGPVEFSFEPRRDGVEIGWRADWRNPPERIDFVVPACEAETAASSEDFVKLRRDSAGDSARSAGGSRE